MGKDRPVRQGGTEEPGVRGLGEGESVNSLGWKTVGKENRWLDLTRGHLDKSQGLVERKALRKWRQRYFAKKGQRNGLLLGEDLG